MDVTVTRENALPVSPEESEWLHTFGWSSGSGWDSDTEFDWFWEPSEGLAVFPEEDDRTMRRFLTDLDTARRTIASEARNARLLECAPVILYLLGEWVDFQETGKEVSGLGPSLLDRTKAMLARIEGE